MAEGGGPAVLDKSMIIFKAVSIMKNKRSCEKVDRHLRAMTRVIAANQNGFLLKDLSVLCELLSLLERRLLSAPLYVEPLCQLVELCGKPFLKEKVSDENAYAPHVLQTLSQLGSLMLTGVHKIITAVALAIAAFHSSDPNLALLQGLQVTKVSYNEALLERSGIAKPLVEALKKVQSLANDSRWEVLRTLQLLSATPTNCNHMLSQGLASLICHVFATPDTSRRTLFVGMEILWNLLEHGSHIQVGKQLSSIKCICILRRVFCELMQDCSSLEAKQLRNDFLMICLQVTRTCPDAPFLETGFFSDLCIFATFTEETESSPHLQSVADAFKHLKLGDSHEDYELKKSLMCILASLGTNPATTKIMVDKKVIRSLLSFVVPNSKAPGSWNPAQFEELQLQAVSSLCVLAPLCVEDYMTCQGNTRLLLLMEWCTNQEMKFKGHGNSFHGEGGRGSKISQLRQLLRLLLSMCSGGDDVVIMDLHEQGAIPMLLTLLKYFLAEPESAKDNPVLLEMQADTLLILSCVCDMDMHRKELFGGYGGVGLVMNYLRGDVGRLGSGLGHSRLLLAAVDCVWCAVVGNPVVEDIFLESEGAVTLLDLLRVCPANMQSLTLGVLVDLCENPKAIPHVVAWKGMDHSSSWALLARLWRAEERDMDVPRGYKQTLAGSLQPLTGAQQNASGVPPIPTYCPSAAITDVTENMRAKIYTLCLKMGFQYPSDELSTEDKITICIIESYLDFKSGEVWNEVAEELAQEGLRPVTPDQECLTEILHTQEGKAEETLKAQHELIDNQEKMDELEEKNFYEKVKEYHFTRENEEKRFTSYVERTSDYAALKAAKVCQLNSLDASRRSSVAIGDRFHSLDQHKLNVTTFCGRHVTVSTTPRKLLNLPVVPTTPSTIRLGSSIRTKPPPSPATVK